MFQQKECPDRITTVLCYNVSLVHQINLQRNHLIFELSRLFAVFYYDKMKQTISEIIIEIHNYND